MKRLLAVVSLATCMWSCGLNGPSPAAPSVVGVITEKGSLSPLPGVEVKATFSPSMVTLVTTTSATGLYSISPVPSGSTWVEIVVGAGTNYAVVHAGPVKPGAMRLDFQLDGRPTYTLSGVMTEITPIGVVPVEGVQIEARVCDGPNCARYLDLVVMSDSTGHYSIPGLWPALETTLWITKAGYLADSPPDTGCHCDWVFTASVDTQLDFRLIRQ